MKSPRSLAAVLFAMLFAAASVRAQEIGPPNAARVAEYEKMLPAEPSGPGPTIRDRDSWNALAKHFDAERIVRDAEKLLKTPMPELTDELYLDYSRTGNRDHCQAVIFNRQDRVSTLVMAECFENQGRFLSGIADAIRSICGEKTWVFPAHDGGLRNFKGEVVEIDLNSSYYSWNMALAAYWLGDKLAPESRKLLAENLERRTFTPFTRMLSGQQPAIWWLTAKMNWNSVCLAGVTGAALASIDSPKRRAFFAASAEKYSQYSLEGFTPDGYCSEGLGYWNYGFGHYVMLAETLRQATGGKVDLLAAERIKPIALYAQRLEILPGIYPAFADSHVDAKPDPRLMAFLENRFKLGGRGQAGDKKPADDKQTARRLELGSRSRLFEAAIFVFPECLEQAGAASRTSALPLRDWFSDAGILICRPKPGSPHALGAALKGGHNAENHNHNDVGSFVVAIAGGTPILDPGSEVYTGRTFGPNRYQSDVLNSFGHPVPRVAGMLQETGYQARAKIIQTEFTDDADTYVMDISSAYKVKGLKKLERTFTFSRRGEGKLTVADQFAFDRPQNFGTALITFSKWREAGPNRLEMGEGAQAVEAAISATGGKVRIDSQDIKEDLPGHRIPIRLGIDFTEPVPQGTITVTITPK